MRFLIKFLGVLLIISGLSLLVKPELLFDWLEKNSDKTSIYIAAILARLILGVLFITIAGWSKFPKVIKIFGYFLIVAATIFLIMGHDRFTTFIQTVISSFKQYSSILGLIVIALGSFLFYAFSAIKELGKF